MSDVLEINGQRLYSVKEVTQTCSYSSDYITRLAREGKVVASQVGNRWFIDIGSLENYVEATALEQEIQKKHLSNDLTQEHKVRKAVVEKSATHQQRSRSLHVQSLVTAISVLALGVVGGVSLYELNLLLSSTVIQMASTQAVTTPTELLQGGKSVSVEPIELATKQVRSLGEVQKGILLFPQGVASSSKVADLFSDQVEVVQSPDGTETVLVVDQYGKPVSDSIPFVELPISKGGRWNESPNKVP